MRGLAVILATLLAVVAGAESVVFGTVTNAGEPPRAISWPAVPELSFMPAGGVRFALAPQQRLVLRSEPLSLTPAVLYLARSAQRRGPGTGVGWRVLYRVADRDYWRLLYWQRPAVPEPTHYPLLPFRTAYEQTLCLPPGSTEIVLELTLTGHPDAGHDYLEIFSLDLAARAPVPLGPPVGPNLMAGGDMTMAAPNGVPVGWAVWGVADPDMTVQTDEDGTRYVRLGAARHFYLAGAAAIPVTPGRAYELTFRVRGKGSLGVGAHALMRPPRWPLDYRVGGMQPVNYPVDTDTWEEHRQYWFADALFVQTAQILFSVTTTDPVDITAVTFRLLGQE